MKRLLRTALILFLTSSMAFFVWAVFQQRFWEELYFFVERTGGMLLACIALIAMKDKKHKAFARILIILFGSKIVWEIFASISWSVANGFIGLGLMFLIDFILIICTIIIAASKSTKWE